MEKGKYQLACFMGFSQNKGLKRPFGDGKPYWPFSLVVDRESLFAI
jgi:hypothetical protein